jgi:hypothetical protein
MRAELILTALGPPLQRIGNGNLEEFDDTMTDRLGTC